VEDSVGHLRHPAAAEGAPVLAWTVRGRSAPKPATANIVPELVVSLAMADWGRDVVLLGGGASSPPLQAAAQHATASTVPDLSHTYVTKQEAAAAAGAGGSLSYDMPPVFRCGGCACESYPLQALRVAEWRAVQERLGFLPEASGASGGLSEASYTPLHCKALITQEVIRRSHLPGSAVVTYHEALGHGVGLPHPPLRHPTGVMWAGQYSGSSLRDCHIEWELMKQYCVAEPPFSAATVAGVPGGGNTGDVVTQPSHSQRQLECKQCCEAMQQKQAQLRGTCAVVQAIHQAHRSQRRRLRTAHSTAQVADVQLLRVGQSPQETLQMTPVVHPGLSQEVLVSAQAWAWAASGSVLPTAHYTLWPVHLAQAPKGASGTVQGGQDACMGALQRLLLLRPASMAPDGAVSVPLPSLNLPSCAASTPTGAGAKHATVAQVVPVWHELKPGRELESMHATFAFEEVLSPQLLETWRRQEQHLTAALLSLVVELSRKQSPAGSDDNDPSLWGWLLGQGGVDSAGQGVCALPQALARLQQLAPGVFTPAIVGVLSSVAGSVAAAGSFGSVAGGDAAADESGPPAILVDASRDIALRVDGHREGESCTVFWAHCPLPCNAVERSGCQQLWLGPVSGLQSWESDFLVALLADPVAAVGVLTAESSPQVRDTALDAVVGQTHAVGSFALAPVIAVGPASLLSAVQLSTQLWGSREAAPLLQNSAVRAEVQWCALATAVP